MTNYIQIILEIIQGTIIIYIGVLLGFLWMRTRLVRYRKAFVKLTINCVTPLLIFFSILRLNATNFWYMPVVAVIVITGFGIYIPTIIAKIKKDEKPDRAEICTATFPNALNFPFPIIFALSPNALGAASIFLATTVIMRNTVGLVISGVTVSKDRIREIILFPPIWGIVFGFVFRIFIDDTSFSTSASVDIIFQVGIIMTLMTVGFGLKPPKLEYKQPIIRVILTRFFFSGIIAIIFVFSLPLNQDMSIAMFVQMIAPPAVYNGLYAEKFGLNTELTSQIIISVTLFALIILPIELLFIQLFLIA